MIEVVLATDDGLLEVVVVFVRTKLVGIRVTMLADTLFIEGMLIDELVNGIRVAQKTLVLLVFDYLLGAGRGTYVDGLESMVW